MEENKKKKENLWTKSKAWVADKAEKTTKFFTENPMLVMPILSGVGMILGGIVKVAAGCGNDKHSECLVEDDVTGEDFLVKHPLTNDEIMELGGRMIDGQWKGDALKDMDLLKHERRRR